MKPIIGISVNVSLPDDVKRTFSKGVALHLIQESYIRFVITAGGIPILLPVVNDPESAEGMVERLDGLIITGGVDVDPSLYKQKNTHSLGVQEARDGFEIELVKAARRQDKALLGICRGCQVINTAFGGSLYQDIPTSIDGALKHTRATDAPETYHQTKLICNSVLEDIFGSNEIKTNSSHHQSVKEPGVGLTILAKAFDGVVEAFQCLDDRCTIAVQWHPERMHDDPRQVALAAWFIKQAQ
ncbi:MAG: gamma-glutamyl-gamma-aminobutyrate hydrolase family protein [Calditrichaeota bacterium]|nr:gamma-glutamyl-gamma-aminobutyrate hydrolase family protein [Calditrichota bacterium]